MKETEIPAMYDPDMNRYISEETAAHYQEQYEELDSSHEWFNDPMYRFDVKMSTPIGYDPETDTDLISRTVDTITDLLTPQ